MFTFAVGVGGLTCEDLLIKSNGVMNINNTYSGGLQSDLICNNSIESDNI